MFDVEYNISMNYNIYWWNKYIKQAINGVNKSPWDKIIDTWNIAVSNRSELQS